jgi:hypothetical protein
MNLPASVAETTIPLALNSCALQQRIHPAASRVALRAGTTPGRFIGFDLLALSNGDVKASRSQMSRLGLSIRSRRPAPVYATSIACDDRVARNWFDRLRGRRSRRRDHQARRHGQSA